MPISQNDLTAGFSTLLADGYIEQVGKGYSLYPLGCMTGKGRVFFEQGGYKDETTKADKIIKWAKNHKVVSWIIIVFAVLAALNGIIDVVSKVVKLLS